MLRSIAARAALSAVSISALFGVHARAQGTFVEPLSPSELNVTVGGVPVSGGMRLWTIENFGHGTAPTDAEVREVVRRCKEVAAAAPTLQAFPPSPAAFDLQFTVNSPPAGAAAAVAAIETYYESTLTSSHASGPVQITVNFGPLGPTTLMSTSSDLYTVANSSIQPFLTVDVDGDDHLQGFMPPAAVPVQFTFGGAVSNPTDVYWTAGTLQGSVQQVVGITAPQSVITVNSAFTWDYDPTNGITAGQVCFRTAFAHEVGHALGFNSAISLPGATSPTQLDLFRFQRSTNNATGFTDFKNHARLVHLNTPNDDHELSLVYAHYAMEDGNPDQASHFREQVPNIGLMDPSIAAGETFHPNYLQTSDLRVLDALGFDWNDPAMATTAVTRFDVEPNTSKSEASPATGMTAGMSIVGTTTGNGLSTGDTTLTSRDMFRVQTGALPLGVYRHTLTLTCATPGVTSSIRGLNQVNGVIGTGETPIQPPIFLSGNATNVWYGFGKQEQLYYVVNGTGASTAVYAATLSTSTISVPSIAGTFLAGPITVKTPVGQTTDTELYIYDGNLNPVPLGHNDDTVGGGSLVTVNLTPGTYYVASSNYNTANNQSDLNPSEGFTNGHLMDFQNVLLNDSTATTEAVSYTVSDGITTTPVTATHGSVFDIQWGRFTVVVGTPISVCKGDGTGAPCPCGNTSTLAGAGCRSPFYGGAGATLSSVGTASILADTLVLTANNIPGPSLFIQENLGSSINFGDGHLCSSTAIVRMGVVFAAAGVAVYPGGTTPAPIHIAGGTANGNTRVYQCWYRSNPSMCSPSALYNLTQGLQLTWGP